MKKSTKGAPGSVGHSHVLTPEFRMREGARKILVELVLPELVSTDREGYKSVAYQNVVPVLAEAMKQQQKQIQSQQHQIEAFQAENAQMKGHLAALAARLAQVEARPSSR